MNNSLFVIVTIMVASFFGKSVGSKSSRITAETASFLYSALDPLKNLSVYLSVICADDRDLIRSMVSSIRSVSDFIYDRLQGAELNFGNYQISKEKLKTGFSTDAFNKRFNELITQRGLSSISVQNTETSFVHSITNLEKLESMAGPKRIKNYLCAHIERVLILFCLALKRNGMLDSFFNDIELRYVSFYTVDGSIPARYVAFKESFRLNHL